MNETAPDKFLTMARDAFTSSTTYFDSSIRTQIEAALRQFQGVHPTNSKYHSDAYKARSRLFRPKTRATIRKNEASAAEAFFATSDVVTVTPEDSDNPKNRASAQVKHALLNYRLKKSIPWFLTLIGAYQDAQTVGVCISHQYWRFDAKRKIDKPCIDLIPTENFRIHPGAKWDDPIGSSAYVIHMLPMMVMDVRKRMTNEDPTTGQPRWKTLADSGIDLIPTENFRIHPASSWSDPINSSPYNIHMLPMLVMDVRKRMENPDPTTGQPRWTKLAEAQILAAQNSYSDSTRQTRERNRQDSTEQRSAINEFATVWVHRNIMEIDGVDMIWYTLGTMSTLSQPVPLESHYWHGRRPYVMGLCILETHKLYPDGIPGITKDTQAEINEVANQRIDNVKFAMNRPTSASTTSSLR